MIDSDTIKVLFITLFVACYTVIAMSVIMHAVSVFWDEARRSSRRKYSVAQE